MTGVLTGLDALLTDDNRLKTLRNARVGLLVNPTSVTRQLVHAVDALIASGVNVVRLFGPEHGVRGEAQDMESVDESYDPVTLLPTISLYGDTLDSLQARPQEVEDLDIIIADIQDIGVRYYTYIYTIGLMMQVCGQVGTEVWVLDRPNPIRGDLVEGNVVLDSMRSFVGMQPLATRHGMTVAECAHFFQRYCGWECDLEVIAMTGWKRDMWFDQTGQPWVLPSPNMPTLDTAIVYPGQCLLEGTDVSEGRGTTRPFECFGAPWVDPQELVQTLEGFDLPGARFRAISFRPKFQKHADETCKGVQIHVVDRDQYDSLATGFAILSALYHQNPDAFRWRSTPYEFVSDRLAIDLLLGDPVLRAGIENGDDPVELSRLKTQARAQFDERRGSVLLYS